MKVREVANSAKPKIGRALRTTGKWITYHVVEPFFRGLGHAVGSASGARTPPVPPDHVLPELRHIRARVRRARAPKIDLRHFMVEGSDTWSYYVAVHGRPGYGTSKRVVLRRLNEAIKRLAERPYS